MSHKAYRLQRADGGQTLIIDPDTGEIIGCVLGMKQFLESEEKVRGHAIGHRNKFGGRCLKCDRLVAPGAGTYVIGKGVTHDDCQAAFSGAHIR